MQIPNLVVVFKNWFFLILFIAFLATPPLVNLIESGGELKISMVLEEENNNDSNKTKKNSEIFIKSTNSYVFSDFEQDILAIKIAKLNFYSVYLDPVSPPPRLS